MRHLKRSLLACVVFACAPVALLAVQPTVADAQANYAYPLLNGGISSGVQGVYPGSYRLSLPSAFNGATITITQLGGNGLTVATYSYTSAPSTPPVIAAYSGDTFSAVAIGGMPTGLTTFNGGPAPLAGGNSGGGAVYGPDATGAAPTHPPAYTGGLDTNGHLQAFLTDTAGREYVDQGSAPWTQNETQLGGVGISLGSGASDTGTQRVVLGGTEPTLPVMDGNSASYTAATAVTVGAAAIAATRGVAANCTAAGNVTLTFSGSGSLVWTVSVGHQNQPYSITGVSTSTATCTYTGLN